MTQKPLDTLVIDSLVRSFPNALNAKVHTVCDFFSTAFQCSSENTTNSAKKVSVHSAFSLCKSQGYKKKKKRLRSNETK